MLVLILLLTTIRAAFAEYSCPSLCLSTFRHSIISILDNHSEAVLAPFHYIMKNEEDTNTVYQKAKWTCHGIHQFDSCLKKCPASFEKSTFLSSLAHWSEYCSILKSPSRSVLSYFSCERNHLRRVETRCGKMKITSLENIHAMCRSLENYRKCYVKEPHGCSSDALQIKEKIDDSLMSTLERLLKMNSNRLEIPKRCSNWRKHRLRKENYYPIDTEQDDFEESSGNDFSPEAVLLVHERQDSRSFHRHIHSSLSTPVTSTGELARDEAREESRELSREMERESSSREVTRDDETIATTSTTTMTTTESRLALDEEDRLAESEYANYDEPSYWESVVTPETAGNVAGRSAAALPQATAASALETDIPEAEVVPIPSPHRISPPSRVQWERELPHTEPQFESSTRWSAFEVVYTDAGCSWNVYTLIGIVVLCCWL